MENGKALELQPLAEVRYLLAGKTSANAIGELRSLASHLPIEGRYALRA